MFGCGLRAAIDCDVWAPWLMLLGKSHVKIWDELYASVALDAAGDQWRRVDVVVRIASGVLPILPGGNTKLAGVAGYLDAVLEVAVAARILSGLPSKLLSSSQIE